MTRTMLREVGLICLAIGAAACSGGGDDDDNKTNEPVCPTGTNATTLELTGVAPAANASVPNSMIAHTFQTVGADAYVEQFPIVALANHTAGRIPETTQVMITPVPRADGSGQDYLYKFTVTWPTAPAHVALANSAIYVNPKDNCHFQLPTPLFEYDITAP